MAGWHLGFDSRGGKQLFRYSREEEGGRDEASIACRSPPQSSGVRGHLPQDLLYILNILRSLLVHFQTRNYPDNKFSKISWGMGALPSPPPKMQSWVVTIGRVATTYCASSG